MCRLSSLAKAQRIRCVTPAALFLLLQYVHRLLRLASTRVDVQGGRSHERLVQGSLLLFEGSLKTALSYFWSHSTEGAIRVSDLVWRIAASSAWEASPRSQRKGAA